MYFIGTFPHMEHFLLASLVVHPGSKTNITDLASGLFGKFNNKIDDYHRLSFDSNDLERLATTFNYGQLNELIKQKQIPNC